MLVLERFEGDFAIIENGDKHIKVKKDILPENAKENCVLVFKNGEYLIDEQLTQKQREKIKQLEKNLWE